jgi:hypothetical protein
MHIVLGITLPSENSQFDANLKKEGLFISRLYTMFLRNAGVKGVNSINIEFSPKFERVRIDPLMYSVLSVFWPFHPEDDLCGTNVLKRWHTITRELSKALQETFQKNGWETKVIREVEKALLSSGFDQRFELIKEKSSPNRKLKARIVIKPGLDSNDIFVEIFKRNEWNKEVLLFRLDTTEFEYSILSKKINWLNDTLVSVVGLKGEVVFKVNVEDFSVEREIEPQVNSVDYIKEELLILDANTPRTIVLDILNMRLPDSLRKFRA